MDVTKVIVPAAGVGSRFLPYTKTIPKEMLPLCNKPAMHYIVDEGVRSEVRNFFIVTSRSKSSIEDYFDTSPELAAFLKDISKETLLSDIEKIEPDVVLLDTNIILRSIEPGNTQHQMATVPNESWFRNAMRSASCPKFSTSYGS